MSRPIPGQKKGVTLIIEKYDDKITNIRAKIPQLQGLSDSQIASRLWEHTYKQIEKDKSAQRGFLSQDITNIFDFKLGLSH